LKARYRLRNLERRLERERPPKTGKLTAEFEVFLYDVYTKGEPQVFFERDTTCPFLCPEHMVENEENVRGVRAPRGSAMYPYSNKNGALGFTIYRHLDGYEDPVKSEEEF